MKVVDVTLRRTSTVVRPGGRRRVCEWRQLNNRNTRSLPLRRHYHGTISRSTHVDGLFLSKDDPYIDSTAPPSSIFSPSFDTTGSGLFLMGPVVGYNFPGHILGCERRVGPHTASARAAREDAEMYDGMMDPGGGEFDPRPDLRCVPTRRSAPSVVPSTATRVCRVLQCTADLTMRPYLPVPVPNHP